MSDLFSPDKEQALWNCARECALLRLKKKCRHYFTSHACNRCNLDIRQYGDFNPQDARLYMMQAEGNARGLHSIGKGYTALTVISILIVLGITTCVVRDRIELKRIYANEWQYVKPQDMPPVNSTVHKEIAYALRCVDREMSRGVDVDKDGRSNCIDAAVVFYSCYRYKDDVQIVLNKHPDGRMNHLFNAVLVNGNWLYIEPQAYYRNHSDYQMSSVWGTKYDPKYNRDATNEYRRYAK